MRTLRRPSAASKAAWQPHRRPHRRPPRPSLRRGETRQRRQETLPLSPASPRGGQKPHEERALPPRPRPSPQHRQAGKDPRPPSSPPSPARTWETVPPTRPPCSNPRHQAEDPSSLPPSSPPKSTEPHDRRLEERVDATRLRAGRTGSAALARTRILASNSCRSSTSLASSSSLEDGSGGTRGADAPVGGCATAEPALDLEGSAFATSELVRGRPVGGAPPRTPLPRKPPRWLGQREAALHGWGSTTWTSADWSANLPLQPRSVRCARCNCRWRPQPRR